jgi:hypothetical protein
VHRPAVCRGPRDEGEWPCDYPDCQRAAIWEVWDEDASRSCHEHLTFILLQSPTAADSAGKYCIYLIKAVPAVRR